MLHLKSGFGSLVMVRVRWLLLVVLGVVRVGFVMAVCLLRGLTRQVRLGLVVALPTPDARRRHRRSQRVVARVLQEATAIGSFRLVVMRYRPRIVCLGQVMTTTL